MPVGMFWQIQSDFEAFICCRLLFWRLRALAAGLTGARQKGIPRWHPTFPVDIVRVKSCVNCFFDPACANEDFTSFQSGWCPVSRASSETTEVQVRASRISRSCS